MNKVKIVRKYISQQEIASVKSYQKKLARKENRLVLKIETVDACNFYKANRDAVRKLLKDWAHPKVGDYIMIVYYNMETCSKFEKDETRLLKNRIKRVVKEEATNTGRIKKGFFIVNLDIKEKTRMKELPFNFVSTYSIPAWSFKAHSTITSKKRTRFEIPHPTSHYRFAA